MTSIFRKKSPSPRKLFDHHSMENLGQQQYLISLSSSNAKNYYLPDISEQLLEIGSLE